MPILKSDNKSITLPENSPIQDACKDLGIPFGCERGECGTCLIDIINGAKNLSPHSQQEIDLGFALTDKERLACQCKIIKGEVEIK